MNQTLRLRISGPTPIHGRKPGEEFEIDADADGAPLDILWRKRLADEKRTPPPGVVVLVKGAATVIEAPASPAPPSKKKD